MFCDRSGLIFQHVWPFFVIAELLLKKSVDSRLNLCYSILAGQVKPAEHNEREGSTVDSYERCCELAKEIARTGWTNSFNPMVKELVSEADQAGIEISFDDSWIGVNDEVFWIEQ